MIKLKLQKGDFAGHRPIYIYIYICIAQVTDAKSLTELKEVFVPDGIAWALLSECGLSSPLDSFDLKPCNCPGYLIST